MPAWDNNSVQLIFPSFNEGCFCPGLEESGVEPVCSSASLIQQLDKGLGLDVIPQTHSSYTFIA